MSSTVPVVLFGSNPIPVGHRFHLAKDVGVFGKDVQVQEREPLVHDLTTGLWFGRTWHFAPGGEAGLLTPRSPEPAPGTSIASRFIDVVRACVVASHGQTSQQCVATTLHVEVE